MDLKLCLAMALLIAGSCAAIADDATTTNPQSEEKRTLEAFGIKNAACSEWSDGCAVCKRQSGKTFACSLPGIACQPENPTCRDEKPKPPEAPAK